MILRLKLFGQQIKNNKLVENFFYLSLAQFVSLLIPLVVTPYLIQILGLSLFGLVTFSQVIMLLLAMVVDFGFNVSATRSISINRTSPHQLNSIFSNVMAAKLLLLAGAFLIFLVLFFLNKIQENAWFYFTSFSIVVGQSFLPTWVYQGIEKMKIYSLFIIIGRISYVILLFTFVNSANDLVLINIFWGGSFLITSIACIIHLHEKHSIRFVGIQVSKVIAELKAGLHLFASVVSINIYTYSNSAVLGFFAGYEAVGLYGIAEKVMLLLKQALIVFSQVFYPAGCQAASKSFSQFRHLLKKSYLLFITGFFICCVIAYFNTTVIVYYFTKSSNQDLELIIKICILAVVFTSLNIPAYQTLLSYNFQKTYSFTLSVCCLFSVLLNLVLTSYFGIWGTSVNLLVTEIFVAVSLYTALHLRHKPYSLLNRKSYV